MRIGSLFSGAGGLDMAVEEVFGGEVIWHAEIDKAASKVLAHRFPDVPNLGDITEVDWSNWQPVLEVDVLCGGFPCQDVSAAGKRAGIKDGTRSGLWAIFADAIDALRPRYVVIENVRGLLSAQAHRAVESDDAVVGDGSDRPVLRAIGAVLGDLSDIGYDAQWATVAASSVGAPHRRERVFIFATDTTVDSRSIFDGDDVRAGWGTGQHESETGRSNTAVCGDEAGVALLPTPAAQDGNGGGRYSSEGHQSTLPGEVRLLPTPKSAERGDCRSEHNRNDPDLRAATYYFPDGNWGKYSPAIRRWEQIAGPAPSPTEPNKNGNPRLSAAFAEWMMGWPPGWVTDPDIGISRNEQLKIVGNGVCPQQAVAALRFLLGVSEVAA